jgi:hypothetical protein
MATETTETDLREIQALNPLKCLNIHGVQLRPLAVGAFQRKLLAGHSSALAFDDLMNAAQAIIRNTKSLQIANFMIPTTARYLQYSGPQKPCKRPV